MTTILRSAGLITALLWSAALRADDLPSDQLAAVACEIGRINADDDDRTVQYDAEPLFHGFVFLGGRYVPPPYLLRCDGRDVTINGIAVPLGRVAMSPPVHGSQLLSRYEHHLRNDGMLLSADGEPPVALDANWTLRVMETMLKNLTWPAKCDALVRLGCNDVHSGQWSALVQGFRSTADIVERVEMLRERIRYADKSAASAPPPSGILAAVGMGLALLGFTTVVNHRPRYTNQRLSSVSERGGQLVLRCVGVFLILSVFDLGCTYFAAPPGTLWRLHLPTLGIPDDPVLAASLKGALAISASVALLSFRDCRFGQFGSWWACLTYTVLMVRWTTFSSLLAH